MNRNIHSLRRWKVLVTPKEACELIGSLSQSFLSSVDMTLTYGRVNDPGRLTALLMDKDAVVLDLEPITQKILKSCPGLKIISRFGEGYDAIDTKAVKRCGIRLARTRGVSSMAVARHAMALILALLHNIVENNSTLKHGDWVRNMNISEEAATLGILGFGKTGRALSSIAYDLGFRVLVYHRHKGEKNRRYEFFDDIDKITAQSKIISLHLPLTPETKELISQKLMRKIDGKYLVNTSRGGLIDEGLLLAMLKKNKLLGYATDVFSVEPIEGISKKLAQHPRVICSPHVAALDRITAIKMTERAIRNVLYCLNNEHRKVVSYVM